MHRRCKNESHFLEKGYAEMSETKKRGWIKNVIIIFLVIMLVLTLFSNTIMNRSLPEVSVQYAESGTITTQIKLSGSVSANQIKQVTLENARTVDAVNVRRGDYVERGTVLATLLAGESSEIYDLEIALKQLQIEYKKLLLEDSDSLLTHQRTLEDSQKELAELEAYIEKYPTLAAVVQAYEDEIAVDKNKIKEIEDSIEEIEESIEELQKLMEDLPVPAYRNTADLNDAIDEAQDALDDAEAATKAAKKALSTATKVKNDATQAYNALNEKYEKLKEEADTLTLAVEELEDSLAAKKQELTSTKEQLADKREERSELLRLIAAQMKKEYILWNKDNVEDSKIVEDIREYSNGQIILSEEKLNLGIYRAPAQQQFKHNGKNQKKKKNKKY